jgi:aryl-alcohol dehydrogenase-like predicted oxidoreductase
MERREFLKSSALVAGLALAPSLLWARAKGKGEVPRRRFGGTREMVPAIDRGVTFMDNCWDYHDGESERRMGKALRDGYRKKVFLMTKIDGRTRDAAMRQTDVIDLMQMPLNVFDAHFRSFEKLVLPELVKRKIAVLGMKPLASGHILACTAKFAASGEHEPFKTTQHFDGTAHNPQWLELRRLRRIPSSRRTAGRMRGRWRARRGRAA